MRDVLEDLMRWWSAGDPVGLATVVGTQRSAPRPPGAAMVIGPDGTVAGSVSGGCVEGAVYELARQVVASGAPVLQRDVQGMLAAGSIGTVQYGQDGERRGNELTLFVNSFAPPADAGLPA